MLGQLRVDLSDLQAQYELKPETSTLKDIETLEKYIEKLSKYIQEKESGKSKTDSDFNQKSKTAQQLDDERMGIIRQQEALKSNEKQKVNPF